MGLFGKILAVPVRVVNAPLQALEKLVDTLWVSPMRCGHSCRPEEANELLEAVKARIYRIDPAEANRLLKAVKARSKQGDKDNVISALLDVVAQALEEVND